MKTAVSLPEEVFAGAEALAQAQHSSRSRLYTAALREYLSRHQPDAVTAGLDAVYADESSNLDPALAHATAGMLEASEW